MRYAGADTFSIRNLTDRPLVFTSVTPDHPAWTASWSAAFGTRFAFPGQVIQSGQVAFIDLARFDSLSRNPRAFRPTNKVWIHFTIGVDGPDVTAMLYNNGDSYRHQTAYTCIPSDSAWSCWVDPDGHGADVYLTNPTDLDVPASEPGIQARLMQALCQPGNAAVHCDLATKQKTLDEGTMPIAQVGDRQYNYTDEKSTHSWDQEWEMGTSMKIGASESLGLGLGVDEFVKLEVKATFEHDWGSSHSMGVTNIINIPPGDVGWIDAEIPALEVTGDLRVGIGNQWWTLQGVTFMTPDAGPDGAFSWFASGKTRPMTPAEKAAEPSTGTPGVGWPHPPSSGDRAVVSGS